MMMLGLVKKLSVQSKELNVSEKEGMVMKAKWMILALLLSMFFFDWMLQTATLRKVCFKIWCNDVQRRRLFLLCP